jgi:hypothetical protein
MATGYYPKPGSTHVTDRNPTARAGTGSMDPMGEHDYYEPVITSRVYFALDPDACQIKIGYTTRTPEQRLQELQARRPNLELLGSLRGGHRLERAMHNRFRNYKREGQEWFSSEIIADVAELLAA